MARVVLPGSDMDPYTCLLAIPSDTRYEPLRRLRRLALAQVISALERAESVTDAAGKLGTTYRALARLVIDRPEIREAYDRAAVAKFRTGRYTRTA